MVQIKALCMLLVLCHSVAISTAFAGSVSCPKDITKERFVAIQSRIVDGYRFDITIAPVYAQNSKVYANVQNGEGTVGDSFILVTGPAGKVVHFERIATLRHFVDDLGKFVTTQKGEIDVTILQHSGGISCCEYLHFFQTQNGFKYLGREKVGYR